MFNIHFVWNIVRGFLCAKECGPGTFSFRMMHEAAEATDLTKFQEIRWVLALSR